MREFLKAYWPFLAIGLLGLIIAMRFIEPAPPRQITLAAGSPGGAYYAYAERYQRMLGDIGVDVTIQETAGSVDNLRMVRDGDSDVALIQGGLANSDADPDLQTLGGLFPEPVWVFVRKDFPATSFADLKSARFAIGQQGSGTRDLALDLQAEWDGGWPSQSKLTLSGSAAATALKAGDVDALIYVAAIDAPYVQTLLVNEDINLLAFPRSPALARRYPALAPNTLLRGVLDIGRDLPSEDIPLIAPVAQLVVSRDMHPAIESALLEAAHAIHGEGSLLATAGSYPNPQLTDLPLSREARRYYRNGPSALRRWFSFSWANFLERSWVLLIPLITLMIPLARVAPPIYRWRVRRKIYVWYSDLRALEVRGRSSSTLSERNKIISELHKLQVDAGKIEVPLSYTDDLYRLRNHIEFVESLLRRLKADEKMTKEDAEKALS